MPTEVARDHFKWTMQKIRRIVANITCFEQVCMLALEGLSDVVRHGRCVIDLTHSPAKYIYCLPEKVYV